MDQRVAMQAHGRLSLPKGEGEGEGFAGPTRGIEPLTFILSPCPRGEAKNENIVKSAKFQCETRRY
jgi:hypothetical protein